MNKVASWQILTGALGAVGLVLPWFKPHAPAIETGVWHSWDSVWICLLVAAVYGLSGLTGVLLTKANASSASDAHAVARIFDRALWAPLLGIGALGFQYWNLPHDYVACPAYYDSTTCGIAGTSAWIHEPGGSRGVQFGFWLALIACCMALAGSIWLFAQRDAVAETLLEHTATLSNDRLAREAARSAVKRGAAGVSTTGEYEADATLENEATGRAA